MSTFTILPRLASLGKILKADTITILENLVVLVVFDFYLRIEIMGKVLFLSEVVTYAHNHGDNALMFKKKKQNGSMLSF